MEIPVSVDRSVTPIATEDDPVSDVIEILTIAVAVDEHERKLLDQWRPGTEPPAVDSEWRLLGYDICDRVERSALMNCATRDRHKPAGYWPFLINQYHLFDRLTDAAQFKQLSDERIVAHAPFVVMALLLRTQIAL